MNSLKLAIINKVNAAMAAGRNISMAENFKAASQSIGKALSIATLALAVSGCVSSVQRTADPSINTQRLTAPGVSQPLVLHTDAADFLESAMRPILVAAGLGDMDVEVNNRTLPELGVQRVNIFLIESHQFNAFVRGTNNYNIYMHSSVLKNARTPSEVQFILAHELGHIVAGDIRALQSRVSAASKRNTVTSVLAIGGAILGANLDPENASTYGQAARVATGASAQTERNSLFGFSRERETEADRYAIGIFQRANIGLLNTTAMMLCMKYQTGGGRSLTHPATDARIDMVERATTRTSMREDSRLVNQLQAAQRAINPSGEQSLCRIPGSDATPTLSVQEQLDAQRRAETLRR